jgi:hypothetical protein
MEKKELPVTVVHEEWVLERQRFVPYTPSCREPTRSIVFREKAASHNNDLIFVLLPALSETPF